MNRATIISVAALVIAACGLSSRAAAPPPANVPQNVHVSQISAGAAKNSTSFVFEWDQARNLATNALYTTYEFGKKCAYTYTGADKAVGGNSGLTLMTGPGPHYKLTANCTCDRGVAYAMVRVYEAKAVWMGPQNLSQSLMKGPMAFYATCSPS